MGNFGIACQTITWGNEQCNHFPEVFAEVAAAGYAGVEIGYRHISRIPPAELVGMLQEHSLKLVASHVGGNLFDTGQADQERRLLDEVADYLRATGTKLLMYSGIRYRDDAQLADDINMLSRAADACAARGIALLYHNHDFEFAANASVIQALLNDTSEALGFCPDVGWVMKGGWDIIEFLEATSDRIGAIHFKDFATKEKKTDTVVLGDGVAPLAQAADWLKRNKSGLWVIAEQDSADIPPAEAAARNAAYIRSQFA